MAYKICCLIVSYVDPPMVWYEVGRYLSGVNVYGLTCLQTPLYSCMQAYNYIMLDPCFLQNEISVGITCI